MNSILIVQHPKFMSNLCVPSPWLCAVQWRVGVPLPHSPYILLRTEYTYNGTIEFILWLEVIHEHMGQLESLESCQGPSSPILEDLVAAGRAYEVGGARDPLLGGGARL